MKVWDENVDLAVFGVVVGKANHRDEGAEIIAECEDGVGANAG